MPKISNQDLQVYFTGASQYPLYRESVRLYESLRVHADGDFPKEMIEERRPSESEDILDYRKKTYKPITKLPMSKVIGSFGKIRRSPDWAISFPQDKTPARVVPEESLERYCMNNLPAYGSVEYWAFGILLKQNLIDANAVVAVIPLEEITTQAFAKPVPILFNSDQVLCFNEQEKYAVLKSKKMVNYWDANNQLQTGNVFYYIDDKEVVVFEQGPSGFTSTFSIVNTTGLFPVFKVKAEAFKQYDNMILSRSRLDAMVPFLDEAACEYSDLKGSKIQHLYPLFWYTKDKDCVSCNGTGKTPGEDGAKQCSACGGDGKVKFSPFAHIEVKARGIGESGAPYSEPAGYITRDTKILELQEKSVEANNFKALAAINMQFLDQTPLAISGEAKQTDREELQNTVYNVAEDLIYSIDKVIFLINEWRYSFLVPDQTKRTAMLPNIPVPQNYDLLPADYLMKEVTDARTGKINPLLVATLEQQLAAKKFYNQPDLASNVKLYYDLDPLPGYSVEDKMVLLQNKAITQEDYVLSSYMPAFIKRALREDPSFQSKPYQSQLEVLQKYAQDKIKVVDEAAKLIEEERQRIMAEASAGRNDLNAQ
ncbi:hypothetical protein JMG10_07600 [Nostoc ellipsosporum NOK]|nr:hypothetical protein [Nostoc ellipsosporum NOK]